MGRSKHTEAQMIAALKQVEAGRTVEDVARGVGVSQQRSTAGRRSTAAWKSARRSDCGRWKTRTHGLKQLVADLSLDREMLKAVIAKNGLSS